MVVEDEGIVAMDIRNSLEAMGYDICAAASSGEEALLKADETRPDLVLMDIVLKGEMDGIAAAGLIGGRFHIPVVYLTAYADDDTLQRAKITTPYGYITKPFTDRELHVAVEIALYRHQAETRIKKTEHRLAAVLRSVGDAVIASDREGRITFMNQTAEKLTGWRCEEAISKKLTEILGIKPEELENLERHLVEKVMTEGLIINLLEDHILVAKDGSSTAISDSVAPIRDDDGKTPGTVFVFRDISERKQVEQRNKQLQEQLFQAQKMESVGRLAGGVAHDFNNMLGVILGHAELAILKENADRPLLADLLEIKKAAERSADITRRLLAFARKQTIFPQVLDLNETAAGMLKMLQKLIGEDIQLVWQPQANLWPIKMDPSQIDQILANLSVNARDAIAGTGELTIKTTNVIAAEADCADRPGFVPGEYVLLSVSDSGCGMDQEIKDKLFEPFFTTKEVGKGTGLGLAMIYGIVKQNNGFIDVESEPGLGTTFRIYFPRHNAPADSPETKETVEPIIGGCETILMAEDEESMLELGAAMLEHLGYKVLRAPLPDEAIRAAQGHSERIDLLVTDVVMPQMNGKKLAETIKSIHPGIATLFMSGYTANVIAHQGILDSDTLFIQKPFTRRALAAMVRKALEQGKSSFMGQSSGKWRSA
jgi:PAS domain S-box-containing protein